MISDGRAAPVPPLLSTPRLPSGRRGRAAGVRILREAAPERRRFLDGDALDLLARLTRRFGPDRDRLLRERGVSRAHARPWTDAEPLPEIHAIRSSEWSVDPAPAVLADRRIEVVGGVRRESIVRGLNSRADVYVADFEDRHSPTWEGTLQAHLDLTDAVHRALELESSAGQRFRIVSRPATLMIRPRGLHQVEGHVTIDGRAVPASFFDFALYVSHAARELQRQGLGPYFRLGGLEHASEARLWADLFAYTEFELGMSPGTIRGCVSVDTVSAAWELDEILHALRRHSAGVAAHRWAYLFSFVKQFRGDGSGVLPGRSALTLAAPIVATYYRRIAYVARRRGAVAVADVAMEPSGPTDAMEANAPAALPSEL
ncbi:MAG: malate synthase A, partial [Thermoplasmata archaeon]|nr:malate synthase A [Thermoplasmata archaeon]